MPHVAEEELERLRIENARLRREVADLRPQAELARSLSDAVVLTDEHFVVRYWNAAAERMYGYTEAEAVGHVLRSLLDTQVEGRPIDDVAQQLTTSGRWEGECTQRHRDGHRMPVASSVNAVRDAQALVIGYVGVNRDITAQVEAREARRREALRAIQLAALAHDLAAEPRSLGRVLETCARGVGRLLDDAVTITLRVPEDDRLVVAAHWDPDEARGAFGREIYDRVPLRVGEGIAGRVVASGEVFTIDVEAPEDMVGVLSPGYRAAAIDQSVRGIVCVPMIVQGRPIGALSCIRFRSVAHDPEEVRFVRSLASHAALAVANARLHAEGYHTQEVLRGRTRELELAVDELEAFAYSVSHDVRAPLRSIEGLAQLIEDELAPTLPDEPRDWLRRLRGATVHLTELVDALLALSRVSRWRLQVAPVDLSALALEVVAEVQERDPERRVDIHVEPGIHTFADAALLRIALMNLVENAWKFTSRTTAPTLEIGHGQDGTGRTIFYVRDNGAGFDPTHAARLFEPFERLHRAEEFPGTGIGLATVSRVVRRHGGDAWAESSPGQGATFFFTLGTAPPGPGESAVSP
jgi:PAS domain S-box-containing protein